MAERQHRTKLPSAGTRHRTINLVSESQANSVLYGHVGRLTYFSPEDEGRGAERDDREKASWGQLHVNRETESILSLRQVSSIRTWFPAAAASDEEAPGKRTKKQFVHQSLAWLYQNEPGVLLGTIGPWPGLVDEIAAAQKTRPRPARLPLLCYGEMADGTAPAGTGVPVLAMAAGSSGHMLRLVLFPRERWKWSAADSVALPLARVDRSKQGHWCGEEGVPIRQLQFAVHHFSIVTLRWLIVQTAAAVTVLEPELVRVPLKTRCGCSNSSQTIASTVKFRISAQQTGGRPICDVSFSPGTRERLPQLCIMDEAGHWSIWAASGNRRERKSKLATVAVARGHFVDGNFTAAAIPAASLAGAYGRGHLHRAVWLPEEEEEALVDHRRPGAAAHQPRRTLLLCNATTLRVHDADKNNEALATLTLARQNGVDVILDMQLCPTKASRVFVLTSTTLFWLDLEGLGHSSGAAPGKARRQGPEHPILLLSCPHLQDASDRTLKICISSFPSLVGAPPRRQRCLVCIYSSARPEKMAFWFTEPFHGGPATFHQEMFGLSNGEPANQGEMTMLFLPRAFEAGTISGTTSSDGNNLGEQYAAAGFQFHQIVTLGLDMDVKAAVCVSSPEPRREQMVVVAPTMVEDEKDQKKRRNKQFAKLFSESFVIPDDVDERTLVGPEREEGEETSLVGWEDLAEQGKHAAQATPLDSSEIVVDGAGPRKACKVLDMSSVVALLRDRIGRAADTARQASLVDQGPGHSLLDLAVRAVDVGLGHGSLRFSTLLEAGGEDFAAHFDAHSTVLAWTRQLRGIELTEPGRVYLFDQIQARIGNSSSEDNGGFGAVSFGSLYQSLADLCIADNEQQDILDEDAGVAEQQSLAAYTAAQLFLSQISIMVVPSAAEGSGLWEAVAGGRLETVVPTAVSTPRFDGGDRGNMMLSSSPPGASGLGAASFTSKTPWWQSSQGSSQGSLVDGGGDNAEGAEEEDDAAVMRLRQFGAEIGSAPAQTDGELRLLSHWQLGSDPAQFLWIPVGATTEEEEAIRREAEEAARRRRQRNEKKAQRERERQRERSQSRGRHQTEEADGDILSYGARPPAVPRIQPSSQVVAQPAAILSSQVLRSSQILRSSQVLPSSQPWAARRPKKAKPKRGFN